MRHEDQIIVNGVIEQMNIATEIGNRFIKQGVSISPQRIAEFMKVYYLKEQSDAIDKLTETVGELAP